MHNYSGISALSEIIKYLSSIAQTYYFFRITFTLALRIHTKYNTAQLPSPN